MWHHSSVSAPFQAKVLGTYRGGHPGLSVGADLQLRDSAGLSPASPGKTRLWISGHPCRPIWSCCGRIVAAAPACVNLVFEVHPVALADLTNRRAAVILSLVAKPLQPLRALFR
jgi:hypothetical protein